jgi:predicted alpha/beta-hydrolase family hydrolase
MARGEERLMELEIATPSGPAKVDLERPRGALGLLVIGHGAGGGVTAPDIVVTRDAALAAGWAVARVTQPYRVAGRRSPAPAPKLDEAWLAVVAALRKRRGLGSLPLVVAGRSSGARVACRTADALGADGVVCLAFPVHPPGKPEATRLPELEAPSCPALVIQGDRDPFGMPPATAGRELVVIAGADHGLKKGKDAIAAAVREFVTSRLPGATV